MTATISAHRRALSPCGRESLDLMAQWKASPLRTPLGGWPRLFWGADEVEPLRARAAGDFPERMRRRAEAILDDPAVFASEPAWQAAHAGAIMDLATAAWITGEERLASMASRLMDRAASAESWSADRRTPPQCDRVAAMTAATLVRAMDVLAGRLTDNHVRRYRDAVREKCLDPFLRAAAASSPPWPGDVVSVAMCGDVGLAALGTADGEGGLEDILAPALETVACTLYGSLGGDDDPHALADALGAGMRLFVALERIWPAAHSFAGHPGLGHAADRLLQLAASGPVTWSADESATMLLLARYQSLRWYGGSRRDALFAAARAGQIESLVQIAWDVADSA